MDSPSNGTASASTTEETDHPSADCDAMDAITKASLSTVSDPSALETAEYVKANGKPESENENGDATEGQRENSDSDVMGQQSSAADEVQPLSADDSSQNKAQNVDENDQPSEAARALEEDLPEPVMNSELAPDQSSNEAETELEQEKTPGSNTCSQEIEKAAPAQSHNGEGTGKDSQDQATIQSTNGGELPEPLQSQTDDQGGVEEPAFQAKSQAEDQLVDSEMGSPPQSVQDVMQDLSTDGGLLPPAPNPTGYENDIEPTLSDQTPPPEESFEGDNDAHEILPSSTEAIPAGNVKDQQAVDSDTQTEHNAGTQIPDHVDAPAQTESETNSSLESEAQTLPTATTEEAQQSETEKISPAPEVESMTGTPKTEAEESTEPSSRPPPVPQDTQEDEVLLEPSQLPSVPAGVEDDISGEGDEQCDALDAPVPSEKSPTCLETDVHDEDSPPDCVSETINDIQTTPDDVPGEQVNEAKGEINDSRDGQGESPESLSLNDNNNDAESPEAPAPEPNDAGVTSAEVPHIVEDLPETSPGEERKHQFEPPSTDEEAEILTNQTESPSDQPEAASEDTLNQQNISTDNQPVPKEQQEEAFNQEEHPEQPGHELENVESPSLEQATEESSIPSSEQQPDSKPKLPSPSEILEDSDIQTAPEESTPTGDHVVDSTPGQTEQVIDADLNTASVASEHIVDTPSLPDTTPSEEENQIRLSENKGNEGPESMDTKPSEVASPEQQFQDLNNEADNSSMQETDSIVTQNSGENTVPDEPVEEEPGTIEELVVANSHNIEPESVVPTRSEAVMIPEGAHHTLNGDLQSEPKHNLIEPVTVESSQAETRENRQNEAGENPESKSTEEASVPSEDSVAVTHQEQTGASGDNASEEKRIDEIVPDVSIPISEGNRENGGDGSAVATGTEPLDAKSSGEKKVQTPVSRRFIYTLSMLATIGGFLFGYDIGIVAGSMLFISPYFELSTSWQELVVSGTIAAAAVAALLSGWMCDQIGRKLTIMVSGIVFTAGGVMMGTAPTREVLLVGRIVSGVGVGLASVVVPVYVAEASPVEIRGRLVSLHQMMINTGIIVSSLLAGGFSYIVPEGWRYMLGFAAFPGVIQFIGFVFMPESPRWLVGKGRVERAEVVLKRIRGGDDVSAELNEIVTTVENEQSDAVGGCQHLAKIFKTQQVRRALFVGCALLFFQQWCGINTVIYYSGSILKMAGFPVKYAIWLVTLPNLVNFAASFLGLYLVERIGRRPLLISSLAGTIIGLVILAVGFQLASENAVSLNTTIVETYANGSVIQGCQTIHSSCDSCVKDKYCGFCYDTEESGTCLPSFDEERSSAGRCVQSSSTSTAMKWAYEFCPSDYTWIALLGMAVFVFAFAPGLGPMPWTINAEIYPLWARSTCQSISACVAWVSNLGISFTFLTMTETITIHGTFYLFTGLTFIGVIFMLVMLPETRNKSLEEVEQLFLSKRQRQIFEGQDKKDAGEMSAA